MKKKINSKDIIRMVYESYKHILKEDEGKQIPINQSIEMQPSLYEGKYYFNITVRDKSKFMTAANIDKSMAQRAAGNWQKKNEGVPQNEYDDFYKKTLQKIRSIYRVTSDNGKIDDNTQYMIIRISVAQPESMFNDNGDINYDNMGVRYIIRLMTLLKVDGEKIKYALTLMYKYVMNKIDDAKEEQIELETRKLFNDICKTLGESKTMNLLGRIQVKSENYLVDHKYDFGNKLRIIAQATMYDAQNPNANQVNTISYLQTPRQWNDLGRQVVNFDYPYHTVTYNGGRVKEEDGVNFVQSRGQIPILKESRFGQQTRRAITVASNKFLNGKKSFSYNDAVYDVQATVVIPGATDKFNEEPAMKNNLTGELNDVAKSQIGIASDDNQDKTDDRTEKLNNLFGTNDYTQVNLIYQATCMAANITPKVDKDGDVQEMIKETGRIIDDMLIQKLQGVKSEDGRIANPKNYLPLIARGRIIIQSQIGLPMDDAPALNTSQNHEQAMNALFNPTHSIINKICMCKRKLANIQKDSITEMIDLFSPLLVFEETFNKTLKLIEENAQYI